MPRNRWTARELVITAVSALLGGLAFGLVSEYMPWTGDPPSYQSLGDVVLKAIFFSPILLGLDWWRRTPDRTPADDAGQDPAGEPPPPPAP